ncbi:hypothetical protein ABW21_db0205547 [Orbilia brochopaga]|nr:hypothetical protein ABW21_db0205547 [Drechslerella brochopaga]
MFFKNALLIASAAFVTLSQALPTTTTTESPDTVTCKPTDAPCLTDSLVYGTSLAQFVTFRSQNYYSELLTYKSDGCSVPKYFVDQFNLIDKNRPYGRYNFYDACLRHDFACHNYQRQKRFTKTNKKPIDQNFEKDLMALCAAQFADPRAVQPAGATYDECKYIAHIYYLGAAVYFGGIQGE